METRTSKANGAEPVLVLTPPPTAKSLVGKLADAFASVSGVEKKGRNDMQHYDYVKAADVAKALRGELFKRGVILISDVEKVEWSEFQTMKGSRMTVCRLTVLYTLYDSDSQAKIQFHGLGESFDSGDKAVYKAHTGALKYALRGMGLIPDEKDDPEADEKVDRAVAEGIVYGLPEDRISELVEWINNASDDGELKKLFAMAYKEAGAKKDDSAMKQFIAAKDKRKQELGL